LSILRAYKDEPYSESFYY